MFVPLFHPRFRFFLKRCAVIALLIAGSVFSFELQYIPVLSPVITNPVLSQIDLFGEGVGSPIFILNLNNAGDTATYNNLRIRYTVTLVLSDNGIQRTQVLYEGLTDNFSIYPNEVIKISSTEFLKGNNPAVRTSLRYMEYELDDLQLRERLMNSQLIPDGELTFSLQLFPSIDQITEDNTYTHKIMNTTSIDLIAPGNEQGQLPAEFYNQRPLFTWTSQLYPGIYGGDDVFEIRLYEARPGVVTAEALTRKPILSRRINAYNFQYPADAPQLVPGYTYYWQVTGFLRGAFTSEIRSNVYGFRILPLIDSTAVYNPQKIDEVLELLRPVIGNDMVEQMRAYVSGEIRIGTRPISKQQLAEIINKIIFGEFTNDEPFIQ